MAFLQFMKTNAKNVIDLAGVLVVLFSYARSQESKKTRSRLLSIGIRYTQEQSPAKYDTSLFPFILFLLYRFFLYSLFPGENPLFRSPSERLASDCRNSVIVSPNILATFHLPISDSTK
jgi:hypothetical protein